MTGLPGPPERFGLDRFVAAQDAGATYERAREELAQGRKRTHWMWFVFPQLVGLGSSPTANRFAIGSLEEAVAYLEHPVLGPRLRDASALVAASPAPDAVALLGELDAMKLRSSMTLFSRAAPDEPVFHRVLERYYDGEGDVRTEALLAGR